MARVRLLDPQDVAPEDRAFFEGLAATGGFINLYRAMAHSPTALRNLLALLTDLWNGALSTRIREIAILSVASASAAPYPLGWHILDAAEAGLTDPEIRAVVGGDAAAVLPHDEASVAAFARELSVGATVSDATYEAAARSLDQRQLVELTMLVGLYRLVACFANGLEVDLDEAPARALGR